MKYHLPVYKLPKGFELRKPAVSESEQDNPDPCMEWFAGFKDKFAEMRDSWPFDLQRISLEDMKALFIEHVFPDSIRPLVEYVGIGTKRIVFVSKSNVAFKFQYNDYGDQGRHEIVEALAWPDLKCFPKLLDYSADGQCCAFEVAKEPTIKNFTDGLGQASSWIQDKLQDYAADGENRYLDMLLESGIMNEEQDASFRDLMKFFRQMFLKQGKTLSDLDHADNWGLMYRRNMPVIVVTDFGL